ncbi:hypothetical protein [Acinetobacter phage P577]|uniref:hypothetical protein n=1 Tax=Acinetobacter phage YMC13/03/R2096 TaxID=1560342 RepID=UPI00052AB294|nr:hypothetical protein ACQ36_gp093 [Acinetobacter phage YMC13/03/R2096]AIW02840.1 hypothetical protein BPABA577_01060 [Acinetobacter phage YMC13/03/R2096]WNT46164.1 hypothetical protein [Acinetobacter phage P577]
MSKNSHVNTLEVVNGGQPVVSIQDLNTARKNKLFHDGLQRVYEKMYRSGFMKDTTPKQQKMIEEEPIMMLSRELYPSRQAYRHALRSWAKQKERFAKADSRGLLPEHLKVHLTGLA